MSGRCAITGVGLVTPIGVGREPFWRAALEGRSGVGPISVFDPAEFKVQVAAEVKGFDFTAACGLPAPAGLGKQALFALAAAHQALADAGLELARLPRRKVAIAAGCLFGEPLEFEGMTRRFTQGDPSAAEARDLFHHPFPSLSQSLSEALGAGGPSETLYAACSSGNVALARACELIECGQAEVVLAGGADVLNLGIFANFHGLRLLARRRCRPFDRGRDGLIFGEGAGMLVVESTARARERGRAGYAEVAGCGITCDAYHPSSPDPEGRGLLAAMAEAVARAGLRPEQIDYVSAHGTGTRINDRVEVAALRRFFGGHAARLAASSVKSMFGHTMGAASAIETAVCCLALRDQVLPPTIHYEDTDPECVIDCVPNQARAQPVSVCMNNSMGFGGVNASVILRRPEQG